MNIQRLANWCVRLKRIKVAMRGLDESTNRLTARFVQMFLEGEGVEEQIVCP